MKMIQISDLHLSENNDYQVFDVNTYECAQKIVNHISKHETDADCLIISGDISNDESAASYKHLMEIIKDLEIKVYLMPGNHDSIEKLKSCTSHDLINSTLYFEKDEWITFMLNTKKDGSPNGFLKTDELTILKEKIRQNQDKYFMVFMHHHPVLIGSDSMDKMVIENADLLLDVIKNESKIRGVSWGHVHNVFEAQLNKAKLFSTPSTCFQSKPKSKTFIIDKNEKPGYRRIELRSNGEVRTSVARI